MSEPKPIASLSSSLLARKGQAKPAMRPQGFSSYNMTNMHPSTMDDLGWNDMGDTHHHVPLGLTPEPKLAVVPPVQSVDVPAVEPEPQARIAVVEPITPDVVLPSNQEAIQIVQPVLEQQNTLASRIRQSGQEKAVRLNSVRKSKAAFTLRLDADRHLRLRLASAMSNRSAQRLVTEALDHFLDTIEDIEKLVGNMSSRTASGSR